VELSFTELEEALKSVSTNITHQRGVMMTAKKVCFFGDLSKVLILDLQTEKWRIK